MRATTGESKPPPTLLKKIRSFPLPWRARRKLPVPGPEPKSNTRSQEPGWLPVKAKEAMNEIPSLGFATERPKSR